MQNSTFCVFFCVSFNFVETDVPTASQQENILPDDDNNKLNTSTESNVRLNEESKNANNDIECTATDKIEIKQKSRKLFNKSKKVLFYIILRLFRFQNN